MTFKIALLAAQFAGLLLLKFHSHPLPTRILQFPVTSTQNQICQQLNHDVVCGPEGFLPVCQVICKKDQSLVLTCMQELIGAAPAIQVVK